MFKSRRRSLKDGIVTSSKAGENTLRPFCPLPSTERGHSLCRSRGCSQRRTSEAGTGPTPDTAPAGTLILGSQPPEIRERRFYAEKVPSRAFCYSSLNDLRDTHTCMWYTRAHACICLRVGAHTHATCKHAGISVHHTNPAC